ncbi:MAG TPA: AMP-binding protein [Actinomycetota bacterium]|nr:AMP-binding protein [Actinomycetota bacterium]
MSGIGGRARSAPEATAIVSFERTLTFGELNDRQSRLVGALTTAKLKKGDRIAVLSTNRPEFLEVSSGALRAGIVPVLINPLLTNPEIAYQLEDSGARWLFADRPIDPGPRTYSVVTFGDAYERLLHDSTPGEVADHTLGRPMHYTSGTTGTPKGVWVDPVNERRAAALSADFRHMWQLTSDDIHLVCSPLSHSAPHRFSVRTLESGGTVVLQGKFEAEGSLAAIELFSATTTFMVPTHLERIFRLGAARLRRYDVSSLRLLAHAGAPIREQTKRRALSFFPESSVWEFYGSTEGQATRISASEWMQKPGSVGLPRPRARIVITGEGGREVPSGEVGEVWIDDPRIERFKYWRDRDKTEAAWKGSAFTVGDLGWVDDDGYLFLSGRKHDTIITGGVNVYPQEVEEVLVSHPAVSEAVVYGRRNPEWGQEVCALVVPAYGQPLDPAALKKWARQRLASFKTPRRIEIVDELPRTEFGKIRRPT